MVSCLPLSSQRLPPLTPSRGVLSIAPSFTDVQKDVATLIKDRILIGHAISNDTQVSLDNLRDPPCQP